MPQMPSRPGKKTKATTRGTGKKTYPVEAPLPPSWPALNPLVPTSDLAIQILVEDQIVVVRKLFTSFLCQRYVSFLAGLPLVTTPGLPKKGDALRANDRYEVNDPHFAAKLFGTTALKKLIEGSSYEWGGEVCGLNPRIRIYRYTKGQFFDKHCESAAAAQCVNLSSR